MQTALVRRFEMGIIQWDSTYEVHIRKIDRQHRKIVAILNKLYEMQETAANRRDIQKIFDDLREYIASHFKTEEAYLQEIECADYDRAFIDTICSYQREYFKEQPVALINLFNYVWDWFANHILSVDKKCMIKEGSAR